MAGNERFSDTQRKWLFSGISLDIHSPLYTDSLVDPFDLFDGGASCSEYPVAICQFVILYFEVVDKSNEL